MAKITRSSDLFDADRYKYDFGPCHYKLGWAQLDTAQDASYYGNWINPLKLELFSYCEGDLTHTVCEDAADFAKTVRECVDWHKQRDAGRRRCRGRCIASSLGRAEPHALGAGGIARRPPHRHQPGERR